MATQQQIDEAKSIFEKRRAEEEKRIAAAKSSFIENTVTPAGTALDSLHAEAEVWRSEVSALWLLLRIAIDEQTAIKAHMMGVFDGIADGFIKTDWRGVFKTDAEALTWLANVSQAMERDHRFDTDPRLIGAVKFDPMSTGALVGGVQHTVSNGLRSVGGKLVE